MKQINPCSFETLWDRAKPKPSEAISPENQTLCQALFEALPDAIAVVDSQGRIRQINAELERLFGYDREDLLGRPIESLIPERYRARHIDHRQHYRAAPYRLKMSQRPELYGLRRDGSEFPVDVHLAPIKAEEGTLTISVIRDITPHKTAEAEIQEHAHRKAILADLSQSALAGTSLDRLMKHAVEQIAQCLDIEYTKILELLPDGRALRLKAGVGWREGLVGEATVSAGLESQAGYTLLISKPADESTLIAGEPVIVDDLRSETRFSGPPLLFEHGVVSGMSITIPGYARPYGVLGVHTKKHRAFTEDDAQFLRAVAYTLALAIERRQTEEALRESEMRARRLVEANIIGVFEGIEDQICNANQIFLDMLGYSREDLQAGRLRWPEMTPPEYQALDEAARNQLLDHGAITPFEKEFIRKNGTRVPILICATALERSPFTWIAFIVDLSEYKRLEDSLRRRAAELADADRRKDEFLAMLAHELRNPLAPIRNAVHILHRQVPLLPESQRPLEMIERQTQHLARLVDDLLDVSRVTRGKINLHKLPVDLVALTARVVENHRPSASAHQHTVTLTLPPCPLYVEGDDVRLTQVLDNLLNNANKYTPDGGHIWVTVKDRKDEVLVSIRDSGIGIAENDLSEVFDLFAQVDPGIDRARGGLGIGLSLVKRLVEMHGGYVEARSDGPGKGSEFIIYLPLLSAKTELVSHSWSALPASEAPPVLRVLVVDDNYDAAESMALLVKLWGHETRIVHDGRSAVDICQTYKPDVVLLDLGLPGMSGYEVAQHLRKEYGDSMTLFALTGYGQAEDRQRSAAAGFNHHLVKPIDPGILRTLLASREVRPAQS
ncbi:MULTISPECIES: PAS domain S-box protein [Methylocaldum]|uniref:PAS domain S-box protein n=2 Tax=unclassified Methylocaldum TaxID=2622260 RepID=UPI000A326E85|nr:PAS domain S-box protein [Methylocaldum sp. RMAD-M]MBP1148953.1 PAS domain S-box-containing protein [Methylocaldum sp. RMAD-M]MVF20157.1 PAS domain S-box protein [Methylocaldum sp. BRCS4]